MTLGGSNAPPLQAVAIDLEQGYRLSSRAFSHFSTSLLNPAAHHGTLTWAISP